MPANKIDNIDRIRGNLLPDVQTATMNFASVLIKDAISEICEIENKKNV